jgi:hypothetical protein
MKKYSKWLFMMSVMFLLLIILPGIVMAQPGVGDCLDPDVYCPIDGGLSLLVAAGIGYGYNLL